jgi:branched-chain amino acid transport system permease protein
MKQIALWAAIAATFITLPFIFSSGSALSSLNLMGVMIVFALSYNMLFGQTGMLSFCHAVFYGLSGFVAVHAITLIGAEGFNVPLVAVPLVGGVVGWISGKVLGAVATRRAGTAFAMITLGLSELVLSLTPILKSLFGGEEGVQTDRTSVAATMGITFGSQREVYFLIAGWCFVSMFLLYRVTRTPFGRLCNAVRENAQRVEFMGYNVAKIRRKSFTIASVFAGIAGALAAINFETMTVDSLGGLQSAWVLFMTFIGGVGSFFGPVVGAILICALQLSLPSVTPGWQLYLGIFFIIMVMYAPRGIAGLLVMHEPLLRGGTLHKMAPAYFLVAVPLAAMAAGFSLLIEMCYRIGGGAAESSALNFFGIAINPASPVPWAVGVLGFLLGALAFRKLRHRVTDAWPVALQLAHENLERSTPIAAVKSELVR